MDDSVVRRKISVVHTYNRHFSHSIIAGIDTNNILRTDLDSHADSPVVGTNNAVIVEYTNKLVSVSGFTNKLGNLERIPIVKAAIAYDCPRTGKVYIFHINNALYIKEMKVNLIPPFMMRLNGLRINECPKSLAENPTEEHHSIYVPTEDLRIHLLLDGTISYIPSRRPTAEEIGNNEHIDLTPDTNDWDPRDSSYAVQEDSMIDKKGEIVVPKKRRRKYLLDVVDEVEDDQWPINISEVTLALSNISNTLDHQTFGEAVSETYCLSSVSTYNKNYASTITKMMRVFRCSRSVATRTLNVTTQRCTRSGGLDTLSRRYKSNDRMLRYTRLSCDMFMDTYHSSVTSIRGYKHAQLFVTDFNFIHIENMQRRSELPKALKHMFKTVGVPDSIVADGAREQVKGESLKLCHQVSCNLKQLERGTPWSNRAELWIGLVKKAIVRELKATGAPMKLWCYLGEWFCKVNNSLAREIYQLQGQTPSFKATGQITDISSICEFGWYDWIYYRDHEASFPRPKERLGRYLGPADHAGNLMAMWVLNDKGNVLPYQSIRPLLPSEIDSPVERNKRIAFDNQIKIRHGDSVHNIDQISDVEERNENNDILNDENMVVDELYEDEFENGIDSTMPEPSDYPDYNKYINMEVLLPRNGKHMESARVIGRAKRDDGSHIGQFNKSPHLNNQVYDVLFPDGSIEQYSANIIAENIFSQVDSEGYKYQLIDEIIDHKRTKSSYLEEGKNKFKAKTTRGWFLCIRWKDGTQSWKPLKDLKECYPVEVAVYAKANGIALEPGFAWWVPFVLRKKEIMIKSIKSRMIDKRQKYGVRIPRSVKEARELDAENKNTLWEDAISKELTDVSVAFDFLDESQEIPNGFEYMPTRIIFDVKMDFTRKARLVAQACYVDSESNGSSYAGVVSRESVRIMFVYAALLDLDIFAADVQNAYLQAPTSEKFYTIAGPEFGNKRGTKMIIVRALYGMNFAGRDFRNHLRECMKHLGYEFCRADHDVWMRKGKRDDGSCYYEYMLLYTDDCLCISEHPKECLMQLDKYFKLKEKSIGPPKIYLGGKVTKVQLPTGVWSYAFSSSQYVKEAVKNVEKYLQKKNMKLMRRATSPLSFDYRPELDQSDELDDRDAAYYQSLIGILRWAVELGRIDITSEVSMMSSHIAMPRQGHLLQVFHIFAYLKYHHNSTLVFDPTYPDLEYSRFIRNDWRNFYGKVKEELPDDMPEPLGKDFIIRCFVDADHAGEKLTRKSRTGFVVMLNCAVIFWFSKKQTCIETSSFGSEFVAMKQACEYLRGLRFKLRMMGIPVEDPCFIQGDNKSVLSNVTVPESMLKKKSNSIAYHFVRYGTAADEWRFAYIKSMDNPADILASARPGGEDRKRKVSLMLRDIYD